MTQVRVPSSASQGRDALIATTTNKIFDANAAGCVLPAGTYYFPIGDGDSTTKSVQIAWDALIACTITFEITNFGAGHPSTPGTGDTTDYTSTPGLTGWVQYNPTGIYIASTSSGTVTNATIVVAAGTAGGALPMFADFGARRMRVKAVVTTQGALRVVQHGKY